MVSLWMTLSRRSGQNYRKEILAALTDEKRMKNLFEQNKEKWKIYLKKEPDIELMKDSIKITVKQLEDPWAGSLSLLFLEIRNLKDKRFGKVSIKIPGIHQYSHIKIITDSISSEKVTEIEKKCSLNQDYHILFIDGIEELPPKSLFRIFVFGSLMFLTLEDVKVSFEDGTGKVRIATQVYSDFERYFWRKYSFEFPSIQTILISLTLVMVLYLLMLHLRKEKEQN